MTTENRPHEGSQPLTNRPGHLDPHAPDMPDSRVLIDPVALQQGHEPDTVNLRSVLYVPVALVATFVLAYVVVTIIVSSSRNPEKSENNSAARYRSAPINERIGRISSTDPRAAAKQPRLEGLEEQQQDPSVAPNDPAYMRSRLPSEEGNSPHYHPEDLRPTSKVAKEMGLQDFKWLDSGKKVARIPVEDAVKLVLSAQKPGAQGQPYLPVQMKDGKPVELKHLQLRAPTAANPQRGVAGANPPVAPKKDGDDQDGKNSPKKGGQE